MGGVYLQWVINLPSIGAIEAEDVFYLLYEQMIKWSCDLIGKVHLT